MDVEELIENFNDGNFNTDIKPYFNDIITFFTFINKYGRLDEIDLREIPSNDFDDDLFEFLIQNGVLSNLNYETIPDEFKNHYLLHGLEYNYEDMITYITDSLLSDVYIRPDGFYLSLSSREELADYFCEGGRGNNGAKEVAKQILSEDGLGNDWYFDNSIKPSGVVDDLDESKIAGLKDIIFKEIGNVELSLEDYNSDFFESLSEEQGTEGYFKIGPEDLNGVINDDEAFNELCKNDLEDLGQNLKSLYWNSENNAYEDELYSLVYGGLKEYFEGGFDDVPREVTRTDGTKKTVYTSYIKISDFVGNITTFLDNNKGGTYNDSYLDYFGSYTDLIKNMIYNDDVECIDFRIPEYPDWELTRKNINEMFYDYV